MKKNRQLIFPTIFLVLVVGLFGLALSKISCKR